MAMALLVLAGGLVALPHVSTRLHVMAWATAMGLGGGLVMVLFFSVWPRLFGRRHLGRIQGAAQALTVLASAIGPLLLAWCVDVDRQLRGDVPHPRRRDRGGGGRRAGRAAAPPGAAVTMKTSRYIGPSLIP